MLPESGSVGRLGAGRDQAALGEPPEWIGDAPIFLAAAVSIGLVL